MSFDVREKIYTTIGPGSVGTTSTSNTSTCAAPVTNLVNNNVYEECWESFHTSFGFSGSSANRIAVGYRFTSNFGDYTRSQGNQVPMVLDVSVSGSCGFVFDNTSGDAGGAPFGIGVWLHTGTVDGDTITGGRAFMLGQESGSSVVMNSETRVSASINFYRSLVIYPSFFAFEPTPLAVGLVALFPSDRALDVDGMCGDVSARLYRSELNVFNPRSQ